jgi:hypothetical protein
MLETLTRTFGNLGMETLLKQNPDGSSVLLVAHGGRVLGLYPPNSNENFFWTHPLLESSESAKLLFASGVWHNSGGDRTWLAPELDFFFPNYPDIHTYRPPVALDPGSYRIVSSNEKVALVNSATLTNSRAGRELSVEIEKSIEACSDPLRSARTTLSIEKTRYAGYAQSTTLKLTSDAQTSSPVGLWNLIQLPIGGDLLVATSHAATPTVYFGDVSPSDLEIRPHVARWKTGALGVAKIGLSALLTTGRSGYLWRERDQSSLVIRNCFVDPSGDHVDAPKTNPSHIGDAIQGCCVNSEKGQFSELEYHCAAIGGSTGHSHFRDVSQVWAYRGPVTEIRRIASVLLGYDASRSVSKTP